MNTHTICCVAGKSGGHIIPCLTIARNNHINKQATNILFFSANTPLDKTILSDNKTVSWHIMLPLSTRTKSSLKLICHAIVSFIISFFYLCKHRPAQIISTGGIVAIPPCIAGFILRIPITLYSLDAVPGKAIQALTPLATTIFTPFATSTKYFPSQKCSVAPYPIKYQTTDSMIDQHIAQERLKLSPIKKTVLILGGSQGSLFLNQCMENWINDASFMPDKINIIHQTGSVDTTDWKSLYASKNITAYVFNYYPDLALMYAAADLIICRAGAGTLFEIKFFNKQCIIIPLTTNTTHHQVDNARAMTSEYPELFYTIAQSDVEKDVTLVHTLILKHLF
ncbi:MAG TPA: UDP-N-acetylglucosamine--N-acetylmuramyl-(pentapeptide) pyrophosphoryl-undecaprenol N-acetylglucosamine transferase [Candidatus Babeliales bacterium]|jgi:UDP-N-acetylglucosamine--N-acetylmuramyl-(pentapeptide) pyrophosphoryl-undecaprenol N-acetylglucosamine transferase|nr:UDP-N-acetylglucosamine--N-acetylmuramyl-(pentapeptide) pyrophosphoryl-undecaprenol N-acetylglucosamine transferase [Candidatus Babeliales bacterium]